MIRADDTDTRERILVSAERLLADLGIRGASLRAITKEAKANLAAVNYHFGSKEGLVRAVIERRIKPVNDERLQRLDALQADVDTPTLEQVLDALLRPALRMSVDPSAGSFCTRLIGRMQSETDPAFRRMIQGQFEEVFGRFLPALGQACPQLERAELLWRFQFMIGALAFTMSDLLDLERQSEGLCDPHDVEAATRQLIQFAAAGLRAGKPFASRKSETE